MKIFLSWSGEKSHKVAMVFRDWLPSVIQAIEPYVSSEDIDKGARWSTDIARELEDSTYGILCVTKDNIDAPWLTFEAGALSKTMDKSLVCPFLFDIKRSEVDGPILQFQSTIFSEEDIKKLVTSLNSACGEDALGDERLNKAFDVWYPTLKKDLEQILASSPNSTVEKKSTADTEDDILEEVLDLTRSNQKIIRGQSAENHELFSRIQHQIEEFSNIYKRAIHPTSRRLSKHAFRSIEMLMHEVELHDEDLVGFLIGLSLYRDNFPWIYDIGVHARNTIVSSRSQAKKERTVETFKIALRTMEMTPHLSLQHSASYEELLNFGRRLHSLLKKRILN